MVLWIMGYPRIRLISQWKSVNDKGRQHTPQLSPPTTIVWAQQSEVGQQGHMTGLIPAAVFTGVTMGLVGEKPD